MLKQKWERSCFQHGPSTYRHLERVFSRVSSSPVMSKMKLHSRNRSSLNEENKGAVSVWLYFLSQLPHLRVCSPSPPGCQMSFLLFFLGLVDIHASPTYSSVSLMLGHMTSLTTELLQIPCLQILKNIQTMEAFLLHCCLAIGRF